MFLPDHLQQFLRHEAAKRTAKGATLNCYVYDLTAMRHKIALLGRIMPAGLELFYAVKANPHPAFLAAAQGACGIEIASLGEAQKALAAGFTPDRLIYTGPGKSPEELRFSVAHGVRTVHIESLTEAHRLQSICAELGKKQDVLLRINADFDIHGAQTTFSGGSKKFGVDQENMVAVVSALLKLDHLNLRGLHVYAASGVLAVADLLANCRLVFDLTRQLEQQFENLKCDIIDFGGGFGIDYLEEEADFDPQLYADGLTALITEYGFHGRHFVLELGRWLAADSGWFCSEILDIKLSRGKKQVICAGGINHFRRPAALNINHPVAILRRGCPPVFAGQERVSQERVYFGGPLCTSADKLANNLYIEQADIGDIAVFGLAGAYGLSMSTVEFLSHARPAELVLPATTNGTDPMAPVIPA